MENINKKVGNCVVCRSMRLFTQVAQFGKYEVTKLN